MELKRKFAMVIVTLSVALGIGHVMQGNGKDEAFRASSGEKPVSITPLSAGLGNVAAPVTVAKDDALADPGTLTATVTALPDHDRLMAFEPVADPVIEVAATTDVPMADKVIVSEEVQACTISLDAKAAERAMIEISLIAPCHAGERVVLRHGGLAVTARTTVSGGLFVVLPGLDRKGEVSVLMSDGTSASTAMPLPELSQFRRFGVQWLDHDVLQVHAFENGATYGDPGHVSATDPHRVVAGMSSKGGFLTLLGDDSVDLPMLAEVYTYPSDPLDQVEITVEAEVTQATCNREVLGELIVSDGGQVTATDLTLSMPECDAIGDVLVLNNPVSELKLATAN